MWRNCGSYFRKIVADQNLIWWGPNLNSSSKTQMIVYMMFISTFINISHQPYTYTQYMYVAIQRKEKNDNKDFLTLVKMKKKCQFQSQNQNPTIRHGSKRNMSHRFAIYAVKHLSCKNIADTCHYRLSISVDSLGDKNVHME